MCKYTLSLSNPSPAFEIPKARGQFQLQQLQQAARGTPNRRPQCFADFFDWGFCNTTLLFQSYATFCSIAIVQQLNSIIVWVDSAACFGCQSAQIFGCCVRLQQQLQLSTEDKSWSRAARGVYLLLRVESSQFRRLTAQEGISWSSSESSAALSLTNSCVRERLAAYLVTA